MVEALTGQPLEAYFQRYILNPLGMVDTSFIVQPAKFDRLVSNYRRQADGSLLQNPRTQPAPPTDYNGGGGLFSTCGDYVKFMQMILRKGPTVKSMFVNQTGGLSAGKMKSARPESSSDVDFHPGVEDRFTHGFLMNPKAYAKGRSAGSLAWAGIQNTFYWIDPSKKLCATIMMQYYPFCDREAMSLLREFEAAVYA